MDAKEFQVRTTIAALWVSAMMCYIYADLLGYLAPGHLQGILEGQLGTWKVTPTLLIGSAVAMSIPSVMIFLTLVMTPRLNRWLNAIAGGLYALIAVGTTAGAWPARLYYYMYFGVIEFVLTLLIVWYAVKRQPTGVRS